MTAPKKLTPAMQRLVNALNEHGHIDPIRDCGRRTGTNTIVALMNRGILREAKHLRGIHHPATTPEQVWDEAHAEDARRTDELVAHLFDGEAWITTADDDGQEVHAREARRGGLIKAENSGHRLWFVRINGHTVGSAGGTWEEARQAANRFERDHAHGEALAEYREATRADREEELPPEDWWRHQYNHDERIGRCGTCGLDENNPRHIVVPLATAVAQMLGGMAARRVLRTRPLDAPETLVHAFGRDIYAASTAAACGDQGVRGPADTVTCPACRELLAQRAQTIAEAEAEIAALTPAPSTPWAADTAVINGDLTAAEAEGGDGFDEDSDPERWTEAIDGTSTYWTRSNRRGYISQALPVDGRWIAVIDGDEITDCLTAEGAMAAVDADERNRDHRYAAAENDQRTPPAQRMQHRDVNDPIARIVREHLNALDVAAIHHGPLVRDLQDAVGDLIRRAMAEAAAPNH